MSLGSKIKSLRRKRKITQKDLAAKANISRSYLADVENDRYNPSFSTLEDLADALNVSTDRLTGEALINIIEGRLSELGMTMAELSKKVQISLNYLEGLDDIQPGGYDYEMMAPIAEALDLPPGALRSALARQEPPNYEGPVSSAAEDFAEPFTEDKEIVELARKIKKLPSEKKEAIKRIAETEQPLPNCQTIAAHRTDDPSSELPEEARKSIEDFKKFIFEKHGVKYD
ncbi:MAG: transcriptional regulator-like protein [Sporomusa sp.]|jgi:transcriptional regulator with XRE-family HTH domain|nr:transcriptional regulator-like protein [Sporomusa sp.]